MTHSERLHVHLQEKKEVKKCNITFLSLGINRGDPISRPYILFLVKQFWSRPPFMAADQSVDE